LVSMQSTKYWGLGLEGLCRFKLDIDVARPIAHKESWMPFLPPVGAPDVDAPVVDLDLLIGIEVVPDEASLIALIRVLATLTGLSQLTVEMGDEAAPRELDGDVGDVLITTLEWTEPWREMATGLSVDAVAMMDKSWGARPR